jgi:hypothetical protein
MDLDRQLHELLAGLGVVLEGASSAGVARTAPSGSEDLPVDDEDEDGPADDLTSGEDSLLSELCLFQTSREHYGVFYRLDLVEGAPQLRVFTPDETTPAKMRCYLVRAPAESPLRAWFLATRAHGGSDAYDDARDTAQQHLLFAAGELMKRLFWAGVPDEHEFPADIEVRRLV